MSKFRYLDQMRTERDRQETEIVAPYKAEIAACAHRVRLLRERLAQIEAAIGSEIGDLAFAAMKHELANSIMQQVYKQISEVGPGQSVRVEIHPMRLHALGDVFDELRSRITPSIELSQSPMEQRASIIDIRLPPLGIRRAIQST